ncbi:MAG: hypothetical protein U0Z70_12560 [Thermomicrobiales bacterium]
MPLFSTPRQVSPRSRIFQRHGTALAFVLGGALMLAPAASWVLPIPAAMAQDGATAQEATGTEVIAQGVTKLPKGTVAWLINKDAVPGGDGAPVASFPVGFGLTDDGSVEVRDEDGGTLAVLDHGEGVFLPSGKGGSLVSRTADDAGFFVILLVSGEAAAGGSLPGTVVGEPFAAPETRDVELELRRGVLRNDDEAIVPVAASQTPSLLVVTSGTAQVTGPDGQPVTLGEGQFALLASDVTVRSADGSPAEFAVASIGDSVTAGKGTGESDGQAKNRTRTSNAGATAAGGSSGGRGGGGGGGGGGGRAAGGSGGGGQQGGAAPGAEATPDAGQKAADREAKRQAREDKKNQNQAEGTPTAVETPPDVTPATPSPVPDDATDDTVDQGDDDIVIVDQDDTVVDDTGTQDASDPGTGDDTQVVETPVTDDGTTAPVDETQPETPADESPVTEDPVVDQTTGDEAAADETQTVDPNAVTQDPAAEQTDTAPEETVVEQAAPEEVVVEQAAPDDVVVEQTDPATGTGDAAPAEGATP